MKRKVRDKGRLCDVSYETQVVFVCASVCESLCVCRLCG